MRCSPDLSSGNLSQEELAALLYESLQRKILPLPDDLLIYPAHGAGSSCGKNLGPDTYSTLGEEKRTNYALNATDKESFIKSVTEGLNAPPNYFPINARINKEGYESLDGVMELAARPLSLEAFRKLVKEEDAVILDTRDPVVFTEGFVPGAISIGLDGRFAEWAGSLLPFDKPMVLVTEPGKEKESAIRLARVGFDKMQGFLDGGYETWKASGNPIDMIINVEADEMIMDLPYDPKLLIVDVRREPEFADGHIKGAQNIPLDTLTDPGTMALIEDTHNVYLHCAGGYRSVIAASLLKKQGIHNLHNISGGWAAIQALPNVEIVQDKALLN
jgi:hydroxyacylglutathione hydrolase